MIEYRLLWLEEPEDGTEDDLFWSDWHPLEASVQIYLQGATSIQIREVTNA